MSQRMTAKPWDVQPGETTQSYRAFLVYRDQGLNRSLAHAASELIASGVYQGKITTVRAHISRWSARFDWQARCRAWDQEQQRIQEVELAGELRRRAQRQADHAYVHQVSASLVSRQIVRQYENDPEAFNQRLAEMPLEDLFALQARLVGPWATAMEKERLALGMSTVNVGAPQHDETARPTPQEPDNPVEHAREVVSAIQHVIEQIQ